VLGQGEFAVVRKGEFEGVEVAVKQLHGAGEGMSSRQSLKRDICVLCHVSCRGIPYCGTQLSVCKLVSCKLLNMCVASASSHQANKTGRT
jgi:hypothetical protein